MSMSLRNAPCPCGSGQRFKHCHGRLEAGEAAHGTGTVDFVVAGAQRCGTTALDLYFRGHPGVAMSVTQKELHFFDHEEHFRGDRVDYAVYHAHFGARRPGQPRGEVTPSYMYWTPAAERLARYNPALRIVILLRNPIARAYSHWNKERQRGREPLPFLEALEAENERARAASPLQDRRTSYAARGFYVGQLQRLWRHFPVDQTLILRSEALQANAGETLARIADFLGLDAFPRIVPRAVNARDYERGMHRDEWEYLASRLAGEIRELERLLGWDCAHWLQPPVGEAEAAASS